MKEITVSDIAAFMQENREQFLADLKAFISFPSVQAPAQPGLPFGKAVNDALEFILARAREMGFSAENLEGYVGTIDWGEGNELIGVLSHADVVPVGDAAAWQTEPFVLTEVGEFMHARGVADDKGPLLCCLYGMWALKTLGFVPQKKLRMIVGANEESGWGCIQYYKDHKLPVPDASFSPDGMYTVVNREKGMIADIFEKRVALNGFTFTGGEARNLVAANADAFLPNAGEKERAALEEAISSNRGLAGCTYTVEQTDGGVNVHCHGKSAHAMAPETGFSANMGLIRLLITSGVLSVAIESELTAIEAYFAFHNGYGLGVDCEDDVSGASTVNLGKLEIADDLIRVHGDIRLPVTKDTRALSAKIDAQFVGLGYAIAYQKIKDALYLPADLPLIQQLCAVYESVTGEKASLHAIGGGTYARAFPNCVCFGAGYPSEKGMNIHMPNERARTSNIFRNCLVYSMAIKELTK